jgi:hypothetical protein
MAHRSLNKHRNLQIEEENRRTYEYGYYAGIKQKPFQFKLSLTVSLVHKPDTMCKGENVKSNNSRRAIENTLTA